MRADRVGLFDPIDWSSVDEPAMVSGTAWEPIASDPPRFRVGGVSSLLRQLEVDRSRARPISVARVSKLLFGGGGMGVAPLSDSAASAAPLGVFAKKSARLVGKSLADLQGVNMVQRSAALVAASSRAGSRTLVHPLADSRSGARTLKGPGCKPRPVDNRGDGSSREFIPWCR